MFDPGPLVQIGDILSFLTVVLDWKSVNYCRTWNVCMHEMFANFEIHMDLWRFNAREYHISSNRGPGGQGSDKMGLISFNMVRSSIQNHHWKALEVYNPKIRELATAKFAKFSCREHFMFYSIKEVMRLSNFKPTLTMGRGCIYYTEYGA